MREHDSTLMTSAPMNPSKSVAYGPTATCVKSRIRSPSKASCVMLSPCSLDDTYATQVCQILSGVTQAVAVHLHIVLTQARRPGRMPGGALDRKRCTGISCRPSVRMVNALKKFPRQQLLRGVEVSNRRHIAGHGAQSLEGVVDFFFGAGRRPLADEGEQLLLVLPARLTSIEFGVICQLWPPHQRTDTRPGVLAHTALQAGMHPAILRLRQGTRPSGRRTPELVRNGGVDLGHGDGLHG